MQGTSMNWTLLQKGTKGSVARPSGPGDSGWTIMNSAGNITPINQVKVGGEWLLIPHESLQDSLQNIPRSSLGPCRSVGEVLWGKGPDSLEPGKRKSKRCCQLAEESTSCHRHPYCPPGKETSRNKLPSLLFLLEGDLRKVAPFLEFSHLKLRSATLSILQHLILFCSFYWNSSLQSRLSLYHPLCDSPPPSPITTLGIKQVRWAKLT